MELKEGMLAISKAGHDKDSWYVVLKTQGNEALLVNGKNRTVDRPKKKKLKHLQPVNQMMDKQGPWTNEEVKRTLKLAQKD